MNSITKAGNDACKVDLTALDLESEKAFEMMDKREVLTIINNYLNTKYYNYLSYFFIV